MSTAIGPSPTAGGVEQLDAQPVVVAHRLDHVAVVAARLARRRTRSRRRPSADRPGRERGRRDVVGGVGVLPAGLQLHAAPLERAQRAGRLLAGAGRGRCDPRRARRPAPRCCRAGTPGSRRGAASGALMPSVLQSMAESWRLKVQSSLKSPCSSTLPVSGSNTTSHDRLGRHGHVVEADRRRDRRGCRSRRGRRVAGRAPRSMRSMPSHTTEMPSVSSQRA